MASYKNFGGNSNIQAYEIGDTYIDVQFKGGSVYRYSYSSAGQMKVERMKELALQGQGLNSYIMLNAKMDYEK